MFEKVDSYGRDLFCRMFIHAKMSHADFVAHLAKLLNATGRWNTVRSKELDIIVDKNDVYDPVQSNVGKDRWLYFPFTLEILPRDNVDTESYIKGICEFLSTLWSSGMDAVAACDFEEDLPQNIRRTRWQ